MSYLLPSARLGTPGAGPRPLGGSPGGPMQQPPLRRALTSASGMPATAAESYAAMSMSPPVQRGATAMADFEFPPPPPQARPMPSPRSSRRGLSGEKLRIKKLTKVIFVISTASSALAIHLAWHCGIST